MTRILIKVAAVAMTVLAAATMVGRNPSFFESRENVALASLGLILLGAILFQPNRDAEIRLVDARWARGRAVFAGLAAWAALGAVAMAVYSERGALGARAQQLWSALAPEASAALDTEAVVLRRGLGGHFTAKVMVDGQTLDMLVDTGSSDVALPYKAAEALGVDMAGLVFDNPVMTANGQAMVATVTLARVSVGGITLTDVPASVAERGRLGSPLLGMSFLGQLSEVSLRGERLFLRK